jgi:hypothetical protein
MNVLNISEAPATKKQLSYLSDLTGIDYSDAKLTMRQASNKIENCELAKLEKDLLKDNTDMSDDEPFSEAKVTLVNGDQRGGKTVFAVGKIKDSYFNDCVKIYCEDVLGIDCDVVAYYCSDRMAKIKYKGKKQYIQIPEDYKLQSPMKIFSNIHLYGFPYVYIPSYRHMLKWLQNGIIRDGWLLMDEAHRGMSARNGMSTEGKDWVGEIFQFGKDLLNVIIITHHAKMIESLARTVPTQRVSTTYDEKTHKVTYTLRKKGQEGTEEHSFDASQYFGNYRTNEKVNA